MVKRTLYFGSACYLSKHLEQLVINLPNAKGFDAKSMPNTIPIEDIGTLILDNQQISITQGLIESLLANNVAIVHCNATHHPVGLVLPLDTNTLQSERFRVQINASEALKKQLWQQIVVSKIKNQAAILGKVGKPYKTLEGLAAHVHAGDPENVEAQAAVYYWANIFDFSLNFRRNREGDYPNNLLNYGYAILRATMARAVVASGMLPTLGLHHSNKYNAYCLADDMMEPYRPFVDALVVDLVQANKGRELDKNTKAALLGIGTEDVLIDDGKSPLMVAMQRSAASLYKCLAGQSRKILLPKIIVSTSQSGVYETQLTIRTDDEPF